MKQLFLLFACSFCTVAFTQPVKKIKPQTPVPPYEYYTDSVEYENTDRSVRLGATFSYPKGIGPFVTLVMITGSGLQDRDETIFDHKPFAVIADYLTKAGFAVLRVDDRGKGKSLGEVKTATSLDFADDVITSIRYLQSRKEVNKNKIGVIGHSEGGFIAPMVYSKFKGLAFIISLAGTGVPGSEILLKQQTDPLKGLVSQAAFDAYYDLTQQTLRLLHDDPSSPDSIMLAAIKNIYANWKSKLPDSVLIPLRADKAGPEEYAQQVKPELMPWLRYFISTDPAEFWRQVKCPVLALNGDRDIQVDASENIRAISNALREGGNKKVTARIFPGLNHLFQTCQKCTIMEYGQLDETISPQVLQTISEWLKKL